MVGFTFRDWSIHFMASVLLPASKANDAARLGVCASEAAAASTAALADFITFAVVFVPTVNETDTSTQRNATVALSGVTSGKLIVKASVNVAFCGFTVIRRASCFSS